MARGLGKLVPVAIGKRLRPGLHWDGGGLYLQVTAAGAKSWIFRYTSKLDGKRHDMGLGPYPAVTLAASRAAAEECRSLKVQGLDPIEERKKARTTARVAKAKAVSFRQCAEACIEDLSQGWRNAKHAQQWTNTLATYAYPIMGDLPAKEIGTELVRKVLKPIWSTKPETASRVRGRIEWVLDWAKVNEYRHGENPARWKGHLDKMLAPRSKVQKVRHHPALPYDDMGDFMAKLRQQDGWAARALEFAILTMARTGEVRGAQPNEFDLTAELWTVPAGRIKGQREHRVPLPRRAVEIVRDAQQVGHPYVFPGGKPGKPLSENALLELLKRMKRTDITPHGFRSSFRDWAAERTNYPREVAEMALAHAVGDKTEAAYRRGDLFEKRRRMSNDWARHCDTITKPGKVLPMRARADA